MSTSPQAPRTHFPNESRCRFESSIRTPPHPVPRPCLAMQLLPHFHLTNPDDHVLTPWFSTLQMLQQESRLASDASSDIFGPLGACCGPFISEQCASVRSPATCRCNRCRVGAAAARAAALGTAKCSTVRWSQTHSSATKQQQECSTRVERSGGHLGLAGEESAQIGQCHTCRGRAVGGGSAVGGAGHRAPASADSPPSRRGVCTLVG